MITSIIDEAGNNDKFSIRIRMVKILLSLLLCLWKTTSKIYIKLKIYSNRNKFKIHNDMATNSSHTFHIKGEKKDFIYYKDSHRVYTTNIAHKYTVELLGINQWATSCLK